MNFNVMNQPCVMVRMVNGEKRTLSVSQVLSLSDQISTVLALDEYSPTEYSMFRFLLTVFLDMRKDELKQTSSTIAPQIDMLYNGDPPTEKEINEYIRSCEEDGCTFDLFDIENPFLGMRKSWLKESYEYYTKGGADVKTSSDNLKKIVDGKPEYASVDTLSPRRPTGTNCVAFGRDLMKNKMDIIEYFYFLIYTHVFAGGYVCGCYNAPLADSRGQVVPIVIGENLWETLLLNTPAIPEDPGKPIWRAKDCKEATQFSLLNRIIYPSVMVFNHTFDEDGNVTAFCRLRPNELMNSKEGAALMRQSWAEVYEPHAMLFRDKEGAVKYVAAGKRPALNMLSTMTTVLDGKMTKGNTILGARNVKFVADNLYNKETGEWGVVDATINVFSVRNNGAVVEEYHVSKSADNNISISDVLNKDTVLFTNEAIDKLEKMLFIIQGIKIKNIADELEYFYTIAINDLFDYIRNLKTSDNRKEIRAAFLKELGFKTYKSCDNILKMVSEDAHSYADSIKKIRNNINDKINEVSKEED